MSWFDTSGLTSFAKTALKEAQKTFDKALDLNDIDESAEINVDIPDDVMAGTFLATWDKPVDKPPKSTTTKESPLKNPVDHVAKETLDEPAEEPESETIKANLESVSQSPPAESSSSSFVELDAEISEAVSVNKLKTNSDTDESGGDEIETTVSSDIEIISPSNGDRFSPTKSCTTVPRGHARGLSDQSNHSTDDDLNPSAFDFQLRDLTRANAELRGNNAELLRKLELLELSVRKVRDERDRAVDERNLARKQAEMARKNDANAEEIEALKSGLREKDALIGQLREEGEKLSKTELKYSNTIKQLRATEKNNEAVMRTLREQLDATKKEMERFKLLSTAKTEIESNQIKQINQLTNTLQTIEVENKNLKSQLDDKNQQLSTLKVSLEAARKEIGESSHAKTHLNVKQKEFVELERQMAELRMQNDELQMQVESFRVANEQTAREFQEKLRQSETTNGELLKRLHLADSRSEELTESLSLATRPLVKEVQVLQRSMLERQNAWDAREMEMLERIDQLNAMIKTLQEREDATRTENALLKNQIKDVEMQLSAVQKNNNSIISDMEHVRAEAKLIDLKYQKQISQLNLEIESKRAACEAIQRSYDILEENFKEERQKYLEAMSCLSKKESLKNERDRSPSIDIDRTSTAGSLENFMVTSLDDLVEVSRCQSPALQSASVYADNASNIVENLQLTLKLRDGEMKQLQWELSRRDHERNLLTKELLDVNERLQTCEQKCADYDALKTQYDELTVNYEAMCQMYGEKFEQVEELMLDLREVKDMYKLHIEDVLKKGDV